MKTLLMTLVVLLITQNIGFSKIVSLNHSECNCITELQNELENDSYDMSLSYRQKFDSSIKLNNEALFLEGQLKEQVVILIHGFMASPFEVKEVATRLNSLGYSVYMPLLYGFGGNGQAANAGKLSLWREQIQSTVKKLSRCYKKISIGGISLGGALALDYVVNNKSENISSLILLSPYFDVSQSIAKSLIDPLLILKKSVDLSTLYSLSRSSDLTEVIKNQSFYSDIMPFFALKEIFALSEELKYKKSIRKKSMPVLVVISEYDMTINLASAVETPQKHFSDISYFTIGKKFQVPHQISYSAVNPNFKEMNRKIVSIVRKGQYTFEQLK